FDHEPLNAVGDPALDTSLDVRDARPDGRELCALVEVDVVLDIEAEDVSAILAVAIGLILPRRTTPRRPTSRTSSPKSRTNTRSKP
ncbi:MAG: hypothetical protein ABGY41_09965, partial [Candidatus Poribacteria bacterium]